jgi:hypothetical protein
MRKLVALGVLAIVLVSAESAGAVPYPRHFGFKIFVHVEKVHAREQCAQWNQEEAEEIGAPSLRDKCVSYSSECRWYTKGRVECLNGYVRQREDTYEETIGFDLWYPPLKNSHKRHHGPRSARERVGKRNGAGAGGGGTFTLEGPRCGVRAKPYLCNGPWSWEREPGAVFFPPECEQCGWATYRSSGRVHRSPLLPLEMRS